MEEITEMGISIQKDKVVINLGTCTGWIGMSKEDAITFAESIKAHAELMPDKVGEAD
jgi:uncharacterized membrane protein